MNVFQVEKNAYPSTSYPSISSIIAEEEKRQKLRALQARTALESTTQPNQAPEYMDTSSTSETEKIPTEDFKYSVKELSSAISRAKTSISAGQAVIKAKRKVLELKRKLAQGNGDTNELMAALNHAKQMERIAKKKKHHLELEELVEHTQKMDEKLEQQEEANSSGGFSNFDIIEAAKDKISKAQEQILSEMETVQKDVSEEDVSLELSDIVDISDKMASMEDFSNEISDMAEFSDEMSSLASEELERLDEAMEMLENLEVINPHMSKEDLKKLKIKHRNSEEKDLVKADMDYLKNMINLTIEKGNAPMNISPSTAAVPMATSSPAPTFVDVSV
ncbi:MAG: hypothetical protein K6E64_06585 [Lachnospiraceae bacterium]|nr:hypothetical protein [Lachnospiraceae bacterium]